MTDKFKAILEKCADKTSGWKFIDGRVAYGVDGFSKSGNVHLFETDTGEIKCLARYDECDEIHTYDDLVYIAWNWFLRYKERDVFANPSHYWLNDFLRLGLIEKVTKEEYQIK